VLIFGASAIVDRGDVVPQGLVAAGGDIVHLGMPVDPGNLLLLGRAGDVPVIGVPSCARSPKLNGFDWVLARTLANLEVTPHDIMDMGAGGLLMEIPTRPLPRERNAPGVAKPRTSRPSCSPPAVPAAWAATNKLLATVAGTPMVRRVAETALASAAPGDRGDRPSGRGGRSRARRPRRDDRPQPGLRRGLAGSLKTGLTALPPEADAFVVCLGDMPLIEPAHIDRLIAAFDADRPICVPVHAGRRGNPVLWSRRYIPDMLALKATRAPAPSSTPTPTPSPKCRSAPTPSSPTSTPPKRSRASSPRMKRQRRAIRGPRVHWPADAPGFRCHSIRATLAQAGQKL
jgi:molybdenum cofactor cytidylyltransferase